MDNLLLASILREILIVSYDCLGSRLSLTVNYPP